MQYFRHKWFPEAARKPLLVQRGRNEFFKPSSKLLILEAVELYGSAMITDWNGQEREARPDIGEPKPWLERWPMPNGTEGWLTFDLDDEPVGATRSAAEAWWNSMMPALRAEWAAETEALERQFEAMTGVQEMLADGVIIAKILLQGGALRDVPSEIWLSGGGLSTMRTGRVSFSPSGMVTWEGPVLLERLEFEAALRQTAAGSGIDIPNSETRSIDDIDAARHPYLAFMNRAARECPFDPTGRTPKKTVRAWLEEHWPAELGQPTPTKLDSMATFLRRPEDEKGGIHS